MRKNMQIVGGLPNSEYVTEKMNRRVRKRVISAVLICLGLTLTAKPGLASYNPNPCNDVAGVWENLANGSRWSFTKNGAISCKGRCSYTNNHGKKDIGQPVGWTPRSRYKWHNFTLFWSKAGVTAEKCDLARGGAVMAIESLGSFRRVK